MTPVRSKRGKDVHASYDLRRTVGCNKKCDGWIVEPDKLLTCPLCIEATTTN